MADGRRLITELSKMSSHRIVPPLPASVTLDAGHGALPRLCVDSPRHGRAEVFLHGAHLSAWQPPGHAPVLFLSRHSAFDPAKPIRGGVPICFPWFGPHATDTQAPMHGFARILPWALVEAQDTNEAVTLSFRLSDDEMTRASAWPHPFEAEFRLTFGASLEMALTVHNTGPAAVTFEEALHTYYAVADIRQVTITGLEGTDFLDKTRGFARTPQGASPVRITGETDRIYLATQASCAIEDAAGHRTIDVGKQGSDTTVVWNPWVDRAKAITDLGDDEWTRFVCVETCNVKDSAVTLVPGDSHTLRAIVTVR